MPRLRVHNFSVSLDGFGAGPGQSLDAPLGEGGERLHEWIFRTSSGRAMLGQEGGEAGLNDELFRARTAGIGTTIMGRNMFSPVRGDWPDESWRGWWGEDPPFGHDVFVLTHYKRPDLTMGNGTRFRFIEESPSEALRLAVQAAGGKDVVLGGGASTIRQFLSARLIDEMHLAIVPVLLGRGERLFDDASASVEGYSCSAFQCADGVAHTHLKRLESAESGKQA